MTSPKTPLKVCHNGPYVKYQLLSVSYRVISVLNPLVEGQYLLRAALTHPRQVHLLLSTLIGRGRRALSLSRNRLHVLADDFIVACLGI